MVAGVRCTERFHPTENWPIFFIPKICHPEAHRTANRRNTTTFLRHNSQQDFAAFPTTPRSPYSTPPTHPISDLPWSSNGSQKFGRMRQHCSDAYNSGKERTTHSVFHFLHPTSASVGDRLIRPTDPPSDTLHTTLSIRGERSGDHIPSQCCSRDQHVPDAKTPTLRWR